MSIWQDTTPRVCVQVSPYITWQGTESEMPPHVRLIWEQRT